MDFEHFWTSGSWLRLGKKEAARHFKATVKNDKDWLAIQVARDRYTADLAINKWKRPQHGSTWFNNWRDWIVEGEPEMPAFCFDPTDLTSHLCQMCGPDHVWDCDHGESCTFTWELACPEFMMQRKLRLAPAAKPKSENDASCLEKQEPLRLSAASARRHG